MTDKDLNFDIRFIAIKHGSDTGSTEAAESPEA
jgi:hypothetical protein